MTGGKGGQPLKTVILDDEPYAIEGLKYELAAFPELEVVGSYLHGKDLLRDLPELAPELLFLDIEMPQMDGFDLLKSMRDILGSSMPRVVFVSAFQEHALQAFEVNALDYLVKPVKAERLRKTLDRMETNWEKVKEPVQGVAIQIHTLGYFGIYRQGRELPLKWRSRKAEELFLYLLMEGGRSVSKEKAAGDLWPELRTDRALSNLYLSLYYVRQLMTACSFPMKIQSLRGKLRLDLLETECDWMSLKKLLEKLDSRGELDQEELAQLKHLYKGPLLEGYYYEWNEVRRRYLEGCMTRLGFESGGFGLN